MVASGYALDDLTDVFITHHHSDHVLELGGLLHTAWTAGLSHPVTVYGPPGLDVIWDRFCDMMAFDINIRIRDEGRIPLHDLININVYDAQTSVPIVILDLSDSQTLEVAIVENIQRDVNIALANELSMIFNKPVYN